MAYTIIDLFCGAGGLSAGFIYKKSKFETVLAIDNNDYACQTYNANFKGDHCISEDIEEWIAKNPNIPKVDIVIGGPPCQGFSLLNKSRNGDARRGLWEPYMDIVNASGAKVFLMENVPEILKSDEFLAITSRAEQLGFSVFSTIFNMADYGVPQTRKRAIIIGTKDPDIRKRISDNFPPKATHRAPSVPGHLPVWRTVKDAIDDLLPPEGTEIRDEKYPNNLHFGRNPTPMSVARYKMIPSGGNRFDLMKNAPEITPQCWLNKPSGSTDLFGRLWWDKPSVTIRTEFYKPEKGRYLHPDQHRPITHREAARIMTFPDEFIFYGSKSEIAKQIGNAVPPAFASFLANYICSVLDAKEISCNYAKETLVGT